MKCRVVQEIDSETPGKPHLVGTIIEHPDAWRLCGILKNNEPVAEPADDEAREKIKPILARKEQVRRDMERQAEEARQLQQELDATEQTERLAEFERLLKDGPAEEYQS